MLEVVAGVCQREGRYLVVRRPRHKADGGKWEFPGGKLEAGETLATALRREWREELAVEPTTGEVLARVTPPSRPELVIAFVSCELVSGEPQALEAEELCWLTVEELRELELCEADTVFVASLPE